ncbi:winged helix-turn-helix transcriptional regulator [Guptibacillus hwajinpoensis]|uniref:DNA-binding HxlR family transcriptional regulator n=1 Tax=Guptibacillus hwajinpoensis TaxID=208199 RepID=A0ABU0K6B5_9BACL|nr:helix-turn-helix domain-containing protein [Alkalihalobacillus hemicentroti]MDQ0484031.1 DNA-binding HxlR family transcriptional regulator [Alkalihalobacillus hemicentroti]
MPHECKVETALDILVGKWKPVILFHIFQEEVLRFSELQRLIPDITKKMLTTQLRELEYHDIINRKVYAQVPPKVEYSITDYGKGLTPLLESMHHWGLSHLDHLDQIYGESKLEKNN